jgi:hypothetical protein
MAGDAVNSYTVSRTTLTIGGMGVGVALSRVLTQSGEAVEVVSDGRQRIYDALAPCVRREPRRRTAQWKQEARRYGRR